MKKARLEMLFKKIAGLATSGHVTLPGRARAVPQARVAAQARPGHSGRAGTGLVATVPCRARTGPKQRATRLRDAWPSIAPREGMKLQVRTLPGISGGPSF